MRLTGPALAAPSFATMNAALANAAQSSTGIVLVDVREQEVRLPWSEIRSRALRMAGALAARGIQPGDRVAIVLPTGADFLDAFFGTQLLGAVPVPLYPPVRLGKLEDYARTTARMLEVSGAKIVLSDRRVRLLLGPALERARPAFGCPTVAELMEGKDEAQVEVPSSALGLIQFSSGSTVEPKPVALTHANLLAQCAALKMLMPQRPGTHEKGVSWLPLYHDMGLIGCLLVAVYWPGELVLLPPEGFLARPALWLRALSRHRGTVSAAPNFAFGLCLKRIKDDELEGLDLSDWTYALNGAEPISRSTMGQFCERFGRVGFRRESLMPVYGLSEASLALTFTTAQGEKPALEIDPEALAVLGEVQPGNRAVVSVGSPVPGCELEVRDPNGTVLPERRVGRVFARAPFVMHGYFGNAEATERTLVDGWLDTGDLGFIDQGQLYICGRAKDVVIIRGANHAPQEFEECLDEVPGVRTGCAVAVGHFDDAAQEEGLWIFAETTDDAPADLEKQIASAIVARTQVKPQRVQLVAPGTLPRTSSGKLRRGEALRLALAGELKPPRPVNVFTLSSAIAQSALAHARRKL
jgi:fatty-acyl-CoA synthase